jgi:hypothetical protein
VEEGEGEEVDLLGPRDKVFEKLTRETEQVDPTAPQPDEALM